MKGREGAKKVEGMREGHGGALSYGGRALFGYLCNQPLSPEFLVTPVLTGPVCLLGQGPV